MLFSRGDASPSQARKGAHLLQEASPHPGQDEAASNHIAPLIKLY